MRMIFPAVGAIVAVIVLPPAATAQQSDEQRQCFAREGVSPEQRLAACTALIDSGGATPQSLVGALISRGNIYLRKRDYGGAIHDYDWAIE